MEAAPAPKKLLQEDNTIDFSPEQLQSFIEAKVSAPVTAADLEAALKALEETEEELTQKGIDQLMKVEAREEKSEKSEKPAEERKEQPKKPRGKKKAAPAFQADDEAAFPGL